MAPKVFVYDPTAADALSKVRGIGRYIQILHENFDDQFTFISSVKNVPTDSIILNPFVNPVQKPPISHRIAKRQIAIIHDLIPLKFKQHFPLGFRGKLTVFKNKHAMKAYDRIITDSEVTKKDIVQMLNIAPEKVNVVYPCLPGNFAGQSDSPLPADIPHNYFLYVGDVTWNKNITMIARAAKKANATVVFVGKAFAQRNDHSTSPWLAELNAFGQEVRNDSHFIFPGYVDNEMLKVLYKNAIANILISHDEGFGFSYIEAASQQTPSILADIPIFHEIAGSHALFVDQTDEDDVARAFKQFIDEPEMRIKLGIEAYEYGKKYDSYQFKASLQSVVGSLI